MKIIVTSFTFPPQANGVSHIAYAQALELAARGHQVTVATDFDSQRDTSAFPSFRVRQFKVWGNASLKIRHHGETRAYQDFIASEPADVILFNCWQNWATEVAVPAFPRTRAKKVIVTQGLSAHVWHPYPRFAFGFGEWLSWQPYLWRFPKLMRTFDHLVFLAERKDFGRFFDHWLAARIGKTPISIIPNGIHLEDLEKSSLDFRKQYGIDEDHYMLLDVANYCDRKNQIATLRAFLRARRKDATLVFIGSEFEEYAKRLQRIYRETPDVTGRAVFLEKVPRPYINSAYRAADIFILTAKIETQPLAILDAMGCGIPFISTDAGCAADFPGGLIVRGEEETAQAINRLLNEPNLARRLGEEGRAAAHSRYSWKKIAAQYEVLFESLLHQAPR